MPPLASPFEATPPLASHSLAPHVMMEPAFKPFHEMQLSVRIKTEAGHNAQGNVKPLAAYSPTPSLIEDRSGLRRCSHAA
jgi:hypothetical protein